MPKRLKVNPNERIDLEDFNRASKEYTTESGKFHRRKLLQSNRSLVSHGFRIELSNQTTSPGQFTVYNGVAVDRDGEILNNEQQINDARVATLIGTNETFYIEIEFAETESDIDSRAFWDSTYTGNIPPGKEFSFNVATRITPDWRVLFNTSDFSVTTDPTSTRIPIAYFRTDSSNEIDNVSLVYASTVLEEDAILGATVLQVLDSSLFPDSGSTIQVGVETGLTLTANNRDTNRITIAGPGLAAATLAGTRVAHSGAAEELFLEEDTVAVPSAPTEEDVRRRLYAGDEIRGSALVSSKYDATLRDDLDIRSVKDHVDFLAAQIREMKFGALRSDTTEGIPPSLFTDKNRYYHSAGSISGARTATITVGDGVTSWGDVNGTDVATAIDTAQAGLDATDGGSIYVKGGNYTWNATLDIDRPMHLVFDKGVDFVAGTYSGIVYSTGGHSVKIEGLPDMSAHYPLYIASDSPVATNLVLDSCFFDLFSVGVSTTAVNIQATNCTFRNTFSAAGNTITVNNTDPSDIESIVFDSCTITYSRATDGTGDLVGGHLSNMEFRNCKFDIAESTGSCQGFVKPVDTSYVYGFTLDNCVLGETNAGKAYHGLELDATEVNDVLIKDCSFEFTWYASLGTPPTCVLLSSFSSMRNNRITGCDFTAVSEAGFVGSTSSDFASVVTLTTDVGAGNVGNSVDNNFFGRNIGDVPIDFTYFVKAAAPGIGATLGVSICENKFNQFNTAVYIEDDVNAVINSNSFEWNYAAADYNQTLTGIEVVGSKVGKVVISNNFMDVYARCSSSSYRLYGVRGNNTSSTLTISGNSIQVNGWTRISTYAVYIVTTSDDLSATVTGNTLKILSSTSSNYGVYISASSGYSSRSSVSGNTISITTASTSGTLTLAGVFVRAEDDEESLHTITGNSINIKPISVITGTNMRGVYMSGYNISASNNTINTWYSVASYGIYIDGAYINAVGNQITQIFDATQTALAADFACGVYMTSNIDNVIISNNNITGGESTRWSIYAGLTGTSSATAVSIGGNTLSTKSEIPTNSSGCILVNNTSTGTLSGLTINGNTCVEEYTSVYTLRRLIRAEASSGTIQGVIICGNNIYGGISGASAIRSSSSSNAPAISLVNCENGAVVGNVIFDWTTITYYGTSIYVGNGDRISVQNNVCSPTNGFVTSAAALSGVPEGVSSNNTAYGSSSTPFGTSGGAGQQYVASTSGAPAETNSNRID